MNGSAIHRRLPMAPDTALLCATIIVAPQLLGGAFPWTVVVIATLAVACLGTALWVRRSETPPAVDGVAFMMGVAWLWTCAQAVALPSGLARAIGAGSIASAERLEGLAWADAVSLTISYEPGATHLQILIGIAILSAFHAARLGGRSTLARLAEATVVSAVLLGLVGFGHEAAGATSLFGLYTPRFTTTRLLAPLMNSNHLAGFSVLAAVIGAGLAARSQSQRGRLGWIAASAFCTIVVAWTLSRGGIGAVLFGFVIFGAWLMSRGRTANRGAVIPVAVVGAAAAAIIAFAGLEPILRRFEKEGLGKLELAGQGLQLLDGSAWFLGVGRGAFSSAFVTYEGSFDRYTHPENLVVQWTTEWGVPVAVALLIVVAVALFRELKETEDPLGAATCIGVFAISLQNLVDFSLEMAGVVVVVAALLGAVLRRRDAAHPGRVWALLVGSFAVFSALLVVLGARAPKSDTQAFVDRLTQALESEGGADFEATLRRGLSLHPGEPALALLAGAYAGSKRHPDAARWLSVAMEEAPDWAAPHAVAARWLLAEGRIDQALLEIREAEERRAGTARKELCELLSRFPNMSHLERAAPSTGDRASFLDRMAASCPTLPAELRAAIDSEILKEDPTRPGAALREARRRGMAKRHDEATALLEGSLAHHPEDIRLWIALIRAHLDDGDEEGARTLLQEARARGFDSVQLLETQARVEAATGDVDQMRATFAKIRGQSRGDPRMIARAFMLEAELETSLGHIEEALNAYESADAANPATPALQSAANLALRAGRPTYARRIFRSLCTRDPGGRACIEEARLSEQLSKPSVDQPNP